NFDEEQGIATVDISDGEARRKLDELLFEIGQFELRDPKVGLGINASELDQGILDAMQSLGIIEDANPEAVASLNWDSLSFQQKLALAELFRLDQETPTPIADADVKAVLRKMQDSIDKTR
ncbi:hypothetical protein KFY46_26225, partial [Salmonella enterica subsp. enterica serovar 1,4,[5],12:i:-]|nr:hypothetical protein [Salmonella enterica subsp. enterica serovar 1,4,[5],12:i:-]